MEYIDKSLLKELPNIEYVYLIQDVDVTGYYKIGRTKNPDRRLSEFGVKLPFEVGVLRVIPTWNANLFEQRLHDRFSSKRVSGEWFDLSEDEVVQILSMKGDYFSSRYDKSLRDAATQFRVNEKIRRSDFLVGSTISHHFVSVKIKNDVPLFRWTPPAKEYDEIFMPKFAEDLPNRIEDAEVMSQMLRIAIDQTRTFLQKGN